MCVVSMICDHYREKWQPLTPAIYPPFVTFPFVPETPLISPEEIAEFRRLLERAREYDKRMNQPDCELDEKRQALKKLAGELGVDIAFL